MNLLTLISREILAATPHIEADMNGCWRLEERTLILSKGSEQIYRRNPNEPCGLCLCINRGVITHFREDDSPSGEQSKYAFEFDPETALIRNKLNNQYLRIELLAADTLTLLDLGELGSGMIFRERFERMADR